MFPVAVLSTLGLLCYQAPTGGLVHVRRLPIGCWHGGLGRGAGLCVGAAAAPLRGEGGLRGGGGAPLGRAGLQRVLVGAGLAGGATGVSVGGDGGGGGGGDGGGRGGGGGVGGRRLARLRLPRGPL